MPKKSKRVASRQAQLSGRSKRLRTHGPTGIPITPVRQDEHSQEEAIAKDEGQATEVLSQEAVAVQEVSRPTPSRTPRSRGRAIQAKPIETYFRPELRRIGLTSLVAFGILTVLIVVSFGA